MEQFAIRSISPAPTDEDFASFILATLPMLMRTLRCKMRANRPAGMSVPQFRTLIFIDKHTDVNVSEIAEHLGLALSTTSTLVNGLLKRQFVARCTDSTDRRRARVTLTEAGKSSLDIARQHAHAFISERLTSLTPDEQLAVKIALDALQRAFIADKTN